MLKRDPVKNIRALYTLVHKIIDWGFFIMREVPVASLPHTFMLCIDIIVNMQQVQHTWYIDEDCILNVIDTTKTKRTKKKIREAYPEVEGAKNVVMRAATLNVGSMTG